MSLLQLAWVIAVRRLIATWRLELVLFLGILLAVALMSSGVAFSDLLAEAALRRALTKATPEEANFSVRVFNDLDDPAFVSRSTSTYWTGVDFVARRVAGRFRPYLKDESHLLETSTLFFKGHPQLELPNEVRPRGKIQYMSGLEEKGRTELVRGRWPGRETAPTLSGAAPGSSLEVALDTLGADLLRLGVGDELEVFPAAGPSAPPSMRAKIVGVFRRVNPSDEFWYGASRAFSFQNDQWTIIPLFTTQDAILEQVARVYPGLYADVTWFFYLDRDGIRAGDVGVIQDTIRSMEYDVWKNLARSSNTVQLDKVLDVYQEQLLLARIPLFLMVFLVAGILVYYLSLVAGLLVRSRIAEISMLKSRGSTTFQVGLLALVEGLLLAVPAVILGPLLALGVAGALGRFFFGGAGGGVPLPLALSSQAFLLGAGGALLAVAVITIATLMAARHGIVQFRQMGARPPRSPFIQRYYLDLLLLALIGLLWWQLQTRGSFLVRSLATRELAIDFSLLLGPVLGLLALGLLVLRAFPLAVALLARVAEPIGPVWLVQGLRHVARDPILPGSLVLLLMLATALGVLGSAFSATLERGQRDRAWYAAGADLRLQHFGDRASIPLLGLAELAGRVRSVERAAEVQRASGSLLTSGFSTTGVAVLAVDEKNFAQVAWYRPDFAGGKSLESLTRGLVPLPYTEGKGAAMGWDGKDGMRLPGDAAALAVWVHPGRPDPRLALQAGLQDSRGYYFDACLGELDFRGWRRLEAQLPGQPRACGRSSDRSPPVVLTPPFILLSLEVVTQFSHTEPGVLFLDRVVAVTPKGEELLDDFQTVDGWQVVEDYTRPGLYALDLSESVARSGTGRAAAFSWAPGGIGVRGIRAGGPERPIPAVVSRSLLEAAEARPGDALTVSFSTFALPVQVTAVAEYFPTLDPGKEPFAVVDLKTFNHYANRHSLRPVGGSNELWVSLADDAPAPVAVTEALEGRGIQVREAHLASKMVSQRVEQPLVSGGWRGLLVLVFLALVLANASGVMLFSYVDTRERQTEFALLRTLGSSPGQLNGVAWFNLFLVVTCGISLGTWAGLQLGNALLPLLGVAEEGVPATPPLILQTNWVVLLVSYLLLGAVTAGTVVWLAWLTAKLEVQRVLRVGEA